MALSDWILIAIGVVIIVTAVLLFLRYRRELKKADDFEGLITESGRLVRRNVADVQKEIDSLEERLAKKS